MGSRIDLVKPVSDATAEDGQTPLVHAVTGSPGARTWPIMTMTWHGLTPSPNNI